MNPYLLTPNLLSPVLVIAIRNRTRNRNRIPAPLRPQRAFTLIELLIVVSIITVLCGAVLTLTIGLSRSEERLRTSMEVEESEAMVRARWRGDILTARIVSITSSTLAASPVSQELSTVPSNPIKIPSLTIRRDSPGAETTIIYRLGKAKNLERVVGNNQPETLARGVDSLSFDRVGQGWRLNWTITNDAGLGQRRVWCLATFATPLTPEVK